MRKPEPRERHHSARRKIAEAEDDRSEGDKPDATKDSYAQMGFGNDPNRWHLRLVVMAKRQLIRLLVLILLISALAALFLTKKPKPTPANDAVAINFMSFTNPASSQRRFYQFSVTNMAEYAVRWHGDWIEIKGNSNFQGRIINSTLPGQTYLPVLKAGESFILNIGEPFYSHEFGLWRFTMSFAPYDLDERWHDLSIDGKVPRPIAKLAPSNSAKILNPTNHIRVSSAWITKAEPITTPK
jgi:hypothetical protein